MKKIFLLLCILSISAPLSYADNLAGNSPIVQIVSYKHYFGKYFGMLWWGSASIINKDGYIVTNNHVVDDGKGGTLDFFNICISKNETEKPKCHYTANLISRDTQKDIALLKINDIDIYGQKVDLGNLQTIEPDYEYTPSSGDEVEAVGYPWVGSETITKTKGIISGTSEYNDATYLKTDTLIAGGNSGGALIKGGKLIGIPTFGIGGGSDTSLGYALLIADAKEFIDSGITTHQENIDMTSFNNYKKEIGEINEKKKIIDNFVDFNFGEKYEVSDYIKDKSISLKLVTGNEELPQSVNLGILDLPEIKNQDDFLYYLQKIGLYSKEFQKLKKIPLSGIDFYTPINLYDTSNGDADTSKVLFGKVEDKIIVITGEFGSIQEDKLKKVQNQFDALIKSIVFNKEGIKKTKLEFSLISPKISVKQVPAFVFNEMSGFALIFPYKNFHEYISIDIFALDIYSGKGKSISSIYEGETKDIATDMKSLITYKGHEGFIYCSENSSEYQNIATDEKGNPLNQSSCKLKIYGFKGDDDDYAIEVTLVVDKKNKTSGLTLLLKALNSLLILPEIGSGETNILNIYDSQTKLTFTDIKTQPEGFKNKLKLLVKYGIIANKRVLNPYEPVKWGEFMDIYFSSVYKYNLDTKLCDKKDFKCRLKSYRITLNGKESSIAYILDKIGIKSEDYVNQDKLSLVPDTLDMLLFGGVTPENLTEEIVKNYALLKKETLYGEISKKIEEEHYQLYGNKKITLYDINNNTEYSNFLSSKGLYNVVGSGVIESPFYVVGKLDFSKTLTPINLEKLGKNYPVTTRATMIDFITEFIDFGLFDPELAKKKDTKIED